MKRIISGLLITTCLLGLVGCGNTTEDPTVPIKPTEQEETIATVPETRKLTLEDVIEISKKGEDIDWKDFEGYEFTDIGSGLFIYKYDIDDEYHLLVGGSLESKPIYVYLVHKTENQIDIRTKDVQEFLQKDKYNSYVVQAFWGSFVGTINTKGKPELLPINMDTAKKDDSLAFVYKLTSKKSMTDFVAAVYASGILDIKEEYNGNPSLNTLGREVFTEDFFKNNSVLMVHQSWLNEKSEFGLKEIIIEENKLTTVIEFTNEETKSTIDDIMNISKTGQLILIEVPNEKLEGIEIFDTELYKE